mmetsp:Transcript_21683/g.73477  ORF Transcript_21683/g.73477 Transcript_21683/m.73477 type:complete len:210 (-) Transcript_21683:471-1100(-)
MGDSADVGRVRRGIGSAISATWPRSAKRSRRMHLQMRLHRCVAKKSAIPQTPPLPTPNPTPSAVCTCGSVKRSSTPCTSTTKSCPRVWQNVKCENACGVCLRPASRRRTTPQLSLCFRNSPGICASIKKVGLPGRSLKTISAASNMSTHFSFMGCGALRSNLPAWKMLSRQALYFAANAFDSACIWTSAAIMTSSAWPRSIEALYALST